MPLGIGQGHNVGLRDVAIFDFVAAGGICVSHKSLVVYVYYWNKINVTMLSLLFQGQTPLETAAEAKNLSIVKKLRKIRAERGLESNSFFTSLTSRKVINYKSLLL